jgi:hypothetical protein
MPTNDTNLTPADHASLREQVSAWAATLSNEQLAAMNLPHPAWETVTCTLRHAKTGVPQWRPFTQRTFKLRTGEYVGSVVVDRRLNRGPKSQPWVVTYNGDDVEGGELRMGTFRTRRAAQLHADAWAADHFDWTVVVNVPRANG